MSGRPNAQRGGRRRFALEEKVVGIRVAVRPPHVEAPERRADKAGTSVSHLLRRIFGAYLKRSKKMTAQLEMMPEILTVAEAMGVLRLSRNSMYEAIRAGQIPCIRIGRKILIPRAALEKMLATASM